MVSPERIRHRIERIEIDWLDSGITATFVDFHVDGKAKWYLGFIHSTRTFYFNCLTSGRFVNQHGRLRDYLVSIIPPEILATCMARALGAHG